MDETSFIHLKCIVCIFIYFLAISFSQSIFYEMFYLQISIIKKSLLYIRCLVGYLLYIISNGFIRACLQIQENYITPKIQILGLEGMTLIYSTWASTL